MKIKRLATVLFIASAAFGLQSCSSMFGGEGGEGGFWGSSSNSDLDTSSRGGRYNRPVVVTTRYHHAAGATPVSHKDRDKQWISQQNTEDFTIEVASGDKPSSVAKSLHASPKTQRAAQYKYKNGDQTRYGGVYGSYKSREAAQAALDKMPDNVRRNAKINNWGNVKPKVAAPTASTESTTPSFSRPAPAASE